MGVPGVPGVPDAAPSSFVLPLPLREVTVAEPLLNGKPAASFVLPLPLRPEEVLGEPTDVAGVPGVPVGVPKGLGVPGVVAGEGCPVFEVGSVIKLWASLIS